MTVGDLAIDTRGGNVTATAALDELAERSPKTIKVKIPGRETPEGRERIKKAMEQRDHADFGSTMLLRRLVEELPWHVMHDSDEAEVVKILRKEAEDHLKARSRLDDEVVRASAGLPPR